MSYEPALYARYQYGQLYRQEQVACGPSQTCRFGYGRDRLISIVTEFELEFGLAKNPNAENLRQALHKFLARMQVLPLGSAEARAYGQLRVKQEAAGRPLESMDMLIAAHSIAAGAILVTGDSVFSYVPDLVGRENWATGLAG